MSTSCLLLFGPPGSGKGTFSEYATTEQGFLHLSSGDAVREEIGKKTALGQQLEAAAARGELAPTKLMQALMREKIDALVQKGRLFIIDGYGRTAEDLEFLYAVLKEKGVFAHTKALFFSAPDGVCEIRILQRLICSQCQALFNRVSHPSKDGSSCDFCGSSLKSRFHDTPDVVSARLAKYRKCVAPVYEKVKEHFPYLEINASGSLSEVREQYATVFVP